MRSLYVLLLLAALLITAALVTRSGIFARMSPKDRPINSAMREAINKQTPQLTTDEEQLVNQMFPTAKRMPSGLRYIVRNPGQGEATPHLGATVAAHYAGRLLDGSEFDSSYGRGAPLSFRLGMGAVIAGWDQAFHTMHRGEKRTLIVPHWLAYGEKGKGKIPPKATLIFEVELIDWR